MIPHLRPWIIQSDREAVDKALSERCVSSYRYADKLSEALRDYSGLDNCSLFASGTLALRASLLNLGLPSGSGVAVPSFTCMEVMRGVVVAGCEPIVIDCDDSGLMKHEHVSDAFQDGRIRAAVAVHQFGLVNRGMEELTGLLPVIEDCCHVPPRPYLERSVGIFGSFEGTKLLGAGEGGYLLFDRSRVPSATEVGPDSVPLGGRLSDVIATLALCQLERLPENIRIRRKIAEGFKEKTGDAPVVDGERGCWFRFLLRVGSLDEVRSLIEQAESAGVTLKQPIMPHPLHGYIDQFKGSCPNAEHVWNTLVSIPLFPDLTEEEMAMISEFLGEQFDG